MANLKKSLIISSLLLVVNLCDLVNSVNHCQSHHFNKSINSTVMQFTKEAVTHEYAVLGEFKMMHCCAKGYTSIEWFKNGKPYPWRPTDVSSLILYPEAENQTIYTRAASMIDAGNYTCVLRNDTHKSQHYIELNVQDSLPDSPMATYKPHDQFITINDPVRLYCEAFVGRIELPDARRKIFWYRIFEGAPEHDIEGSQEIITREDGQIVGAYLTISEMKPHNYGRYVCRIEIGNAEHRLEMSAWIFGTPISAENDSVLPPLLLALLAAILTICVMLVAKYFFVWYSATIQKREVNQCSAQTRELQV